MATKYRSTGSARVYSYVVMGSGSFPLDMLRYDACWPNDSTALASITLQWDECRDPRTFHHALRIVQLSSIKPPTEERWASFQWRCFPSQYEAEKVRRDHAIREG